MLSNGVNIDQSSGSTVAAHDNQIVNNYFGVRYAGTTANDNADASSGVSIGGYNNTVQNNTFGFNTGQAIHLTSADAHDNTVTDNLIGTDFQGTTMANGIGILVDAGASDNDLSDNIIDNNTGTGVSILGTSDHNSLLGLNSPATAGWASTSAATA